MPPLARAVEPEHTVSRSRTITRPAPSRARWYAVLTPMMPAPTITTSAVSVMAVATIRQLRWALNDLWRVSRGRGRYDLGERHAAGSDGDRGARDSHGGARRRGRRPRRHRLGSVRSRSKPDGAVWAGVLPHRSRRGVAGTHRSRRSADYARRRPAPRPRAAGRRARSPAPHAVAVSAALARARADRARVSRGGTRADVDASGLPGTPGGLRVSGCRRPGAADARRTGHAAEPGQRGPYILQRLAGDEPRPAGRPLSAVGHPGTRCGR